MSLKTELVTVIQQGMRIVICSLLQETRWDVLLCGGLPMRGSLHGLKVWQAAEGEALTKL